MLAMHRRLLVSIVAAPALATVASAQTYLGPTPYLSRNDSPLLLTKPELDDLEDGALDLLGVSADHGAVYGPAGNCDSVDADDGSIDGSGTAGHSFFYAGGNTGIRFSFDDSLIGSFPTSAGVTWTDGGSNSSVYFEAFDASGASLGQIGPYAIADGSNSGQTAEDHFFGIACRGGISAIKIKNTTGGIEVDHVQYGVGALSLEANDTTLSANDTLTLTAAGGQASQPAMLVVVGVNGAPFFIPAFSSTFDGAGELALTTTVPSGLAGLVLDMVGLGIAASGKVKFSNEVALTFN
jgi:hypothetical protein